MNRDQVAKVRALAECRLGVWCGEPRFVRGLLWLADHSPETVLSWRQRWYLDGLVYRYRKQLAGRELGFEIPTEAPREDDYRPEPKPQPQPNLFGELQAVPESVRVEAIEPPRQGRLL